MGDDLEEVNASLAEWLIAYNAVRPHQSLGYLTPLEFAEEYAQVLHICSGVTDVLISYKGLFFFFNGYNNRQSSVRRDKDEFD